MDSSFTPDLAAYFARIGFRGPIETNLPTVSAILLLHVLEIPFENLDVLLGKSISLEPAAIERKIVHERRGGYCYEQNSYLAHVLRALGFCVTTLIARVRWQRPPEIETARTHMILRVEISGRPWLVDVGFGSIGATAPLALDVGETEQSTPHEPRRIVQRGAYTVHQVRIGPDWLDVFEFTADAVPAIDYELANWWSNRHPRSHFQQNLVVTRITPAGRLILFNRELTLRSNDGTVQKTLVENPADLLSLLSDRFGLHFPARTHFEAPALTWT